MQNASDIFLINLQKVFNLYQIATSKLLEKQANFKFENYFDPLHISNLYTDFVTKMMEEPDKYIKYQFEYTRNLVDLIDNVTARFLGRAVDPLFNPTPRDNRFKDNAWNENIMFDFIKQIYFMNSRWVNKIVAETDYGDEKTAKKMSFYTKLFCDSFSPSNFIFSNPEVLKLMIETNGENLVKGFENFIRDIEKSRDYLEIQTANEQEFQIGKNIASTKGKVIFQNDLMQLIHYEPLLKENYQIPLLIIPPWINKYYIFDLGESKSFIKWLLGKGYNIFVISWVNPTKELSNKTFEDYMVEGPLAAMDAINKAYGIDKFNLMGYCIGGTLLAVLLAYLADKKSKKVNSATFLTTLLDFKEAGELSVFLDEEQLGFIEKQIEQNGYTYGKDLANVFSLLRVNEMIWSFVINNYMLGKSLVPFDILYWNADSTNLPGAMHLYYLKKMYLENQLIKPNELKFLDVPIDLSKIDIPCYFLACKDDHIVPWKSSFEAMKILNKNIKFVLSGSGHVAGVMNHPNGNKYGYWTNKKSLFNADTWFDTAEKHMGSWWQHWDEWSKNLSGDQVQAILPQYSKLPIIEDAPGSYVKVKCNEI